MTTTPPSDLLYGAVAIALHIYGEKQAARRIYYQTKRGFLPIFRIGRMLCASKSAIDKYIQQNGLKT